MDKLEPMTHILIVYGTTDGHTRKIAQVLAENLRARRCSVEMLDAAGGVWRFSPEAYDGVIVAASVHIGDYQRAVGRWVRMYAPLLNGANGLPVGLSRGVEKGVGPRQEILRIMRR
jgi:menaquinone-dependent protoporphyrinogen oxidase